MAKCVKCGAELIEGARFCRECGTKIDLPAVTPEKTAAVKSEIETTATSLRELADKMLATYVTGMKDLEDAAAKAKAEAESRIAEIEAKLSQTAAQLETKTKEFNDLSDRFSKLQSINQQLQTEKFDAQASAAELTNKVSALEQANASLMAALNAQQSISSSSAAPVQAPVQTVSGETQSDTPKEEL